MAEPKKFEPNAISFERVRSKEVINITPAKKTGRLRTVTAANDLKTGPKLLKKSNGVRYIIIMEAKSKR